MTFPGQMTIIFIAIISLFLNGMQYNDMFAHCFSLSWCISTLSQESRQQWVLMCFQEDPVVYPLLSIKQDHLCKLNSKTSVWLLQYAVKECYLYDSCALGNVS